MQRGRSTHEFFAQCREHFPTDIQREMLEPQVEIATPPSSISRTRAGSSRACARRSASIAHEHGLSIMASGTHPLAVWTRVRANNQPRYGKVMHDLQMIGSAHGGVRHACPCRGARSRDARVDLMNRMQPYLPLLLALSTSSPFWQAQRTGPSRLSARRLSRTAAHRPAGPVRERGRLPALHRHPGGGAGDRGFELCLVGDPPVAEAPDARVARRRHLHAARRHASRSRRSIAASCAVSSSTRELNAGRTGASRAITEENCWRAQRYGIHGSLRRRGDPERKAGRRGPRRGARPRRGGRQGARLRRASSTCAAGSSPAAPAPTSSSPSTPRASAAASRTAMRSPAWSIGSPRKPSAHGSRDSSLTARASAARKRGSRSARPSIGPASDTASAGNAATQPLERYRNARISHDQRSPGSGR